MIKNNDDIKLGNTLIDRRPMTAIFSSHNQIRKRKNSRYQRCKKALNQQQILVNQMGKITIRANKQNQLLHLKPFLTQTNTHQIEILPIEDSKFTNQDKFVYRDKKRMKSQIFLKTQYVEQNIQKENDIWKNERFLTQNSRYQKKQMNNICKKSFNRRVRKNLESKFKSLMESDIIKTSMKKNELKQIKTAEEIRQQEYLLEMEKIKMEQNKLKQRIQQKFIKKYPHIKKQISNSTIQNQYKKSNKVLKYQTATQSKSVKKHDQLLVSQNKRYSLFNPNKSQIRSRVQKYHEQSNISLQKIKQFSYMDYIAHFKLRSNLKLNAKSRTKIQCKQLAKIQEEILQLVKKGSKDQKIIKKYLDQILLESSI